MIYLIIIIQMKNLISLIMKFNYKNLIFNKLNDLIYSKKNNNKIFKIKMTNNILKKNFQ